MSEKIEALRRAFEQAQIRLTLRSHDANAEDLLAAKALLSALAEQEKCRAHMSDKPCDCPNCAPTPEEPTPKVGVFTSNEAAQSLRRNIVEFEEMDGVTRQSAVPEEPTRSVEEVLEGLLPNERGVSLFNSLDDVREALRLYRAEREERQRIVGERDDFERRTRRLVIERDELQRRIEKAKAHPMSTLVHRILEGKE